MGRKSTPQAEQLGPPAMLAAKFRRSYKYAFSPSAVGVGTAIFFAFSHDAGHWLLDISFITTALVYFPIGLSHYQTQKQICEKTIRNYETWYKEHSPGGEGAP